jgi:hypothetical protein
MRQYRKWTLLYSCREHGISLNTFFGRAYDNQPTLIVVKTMDGDVFGGYASGGVWEKKYKYFGDGESFIFSFYKEFKVYRWTKSNNYIMYASHEGIAMGGGDEEGFGYAFYIDADLRYGSSRPCKTFGASSSFSQPLCSKCDFEICAVELWGFV